MPLVNPGPEGGALLLEKGGTRLAMDSEKRLPLDSSPGPRREKLEWGLGN